MDNNELKDLCREFVEYYRVDILKQVKRGKVFYENHIIVNPKESIVSND